MLLAVMSVMSYQAVEVILGANDRSRGQLEDESQLHRAWQVISRDIMHLRPRTFADGLGGVERAYLTDPSDFGLRFSRGGGPMVRSNPTGISRIEYRINSENQLERLSWPITASALNTEGNRVILANNVDDVEVEQFSRGNIFSPDWPPTNERHHVLSLPRMIRITIILEDGSETTRLLPGLDFDPNPTTGLTGSVSALDLWLWLWLWLWLDSSWRCGCQWKLNAHHWLALAVVLVRSNRAAWRCSPR